MENSIFCAVMHSYAFIYDMSYIWFYYRLCKEMQSQKKQNVIIVKELGIMSRLVEANWTMI